LGRKHSDLSFKSARESHDAPVLPSKPSWFRRSLIARESAPAVPQHDPQFKPLPGSSAAETTTTPTAKSRPPANKRATWANGPSLGAGAPMPILPSIRPISPLSNAVTAQASPAFTSTNGNDRSNGQQAGNEPSSKIGRQLSLNSNGNHYAETERTLNSGGPLLSPPYGQKESFFSHLRKRARRFSGRHGLASPNGDDVEANAGAGLWSSRSSMVVDNRGLDESTQNNFQELDKVLQNVRYSLERPHLAADGTHSYATGIVHQSPLKRQHSVQQPSAARSSENISVTAAPVSTRTRRAMQMASHPMHHYETPEEEDELLDEVLNSTNRAARRLDQHHKHTEQKQSSTLTLKENYRLSVSHLPSTIAASNPYPTPSPSAKRNGVLFGGNVASPSQPLTIGKNRRDNTPVNSHWPTPPYEENEWAAAAAASIFAAGSIYR
jgi:meiosis induction protein kinase IME2/SME1